jgi:hypothetical protein
MAMDGVADSLKQSAVYRPSEDPLYNNLNPADYKTVSPHSKAESNFSQSDSNYLNLDMAKKFDASLMNLRLDKSPIDLEKYKNKSIDAFREAIDQNKPLVLVVSEDWCGYCRNLEKELGKPAVQSFKDKAVWSISSPSKDKGCAAIAGSLKIDAYPTITVLEPESRILLERGRINGYFDGPKLSEHLDTILNKTPPRKLPDDFDQQTMMV